METFCDQCNKLKKDVYNGKCQSCYRKNLIQKRRDQAPKIECACGCGELIPSIGSDGKPQTYKNNHHTKGQNNGNYKKGWFIRDEYKFLTGYQGHPNANKKGEIREHILVMSNHLGRPLTKTEVVHHKNKDKLDNRVENLELTDRSLHQNTHNPRKDYKKHIDEVICIECGSNETYKDVRTGNPHWLLHPITKLPYVCERCYKRIKLQIQTTVTERRSDISNRKCLLCGARKSESKSGQSTWRSYTNGKICKSCFDTKIREKKKQIKSLQAPEMI